MSVHGSEVRLCVRDNGSGIDSALLPHIFDLCTQGERTPDRTQGGLGLGLALVRSMVMLHNGRVEAESAGAGAGSTFAIHLPLVAAPDVVQRRGEPAAEALAALLTAEGHQVTVLENGARTLQHAAVCFTQAFILDIGLPDMDGYQLARQLKAQPGTEGAVFIALTGYGQAHDKVLAKAAGFDHHFVKPVEWQELATALAQAAGNKKP